MRKLKGLWKILFGRTTVLTLFLLVQLIVLIAGFSFLNYYIFLFNYIAGFISLIVLIYLLSARQNSSFKMTWIMLILFAPFFGVFFYLFTKLQPGTWTLRRKVEESVKRQKPYLIQNKSIMQELKCQSKENAGLARYIYEYGNYPVYDQTQAQYFPSGEEKFEEMIYQLKQAKEFIFLEYFIVERGLMWNTILEILVEKAKEGVEVRLLYDGTCSLSLLPIKYPEELRSLGIKCKVFAPIRPFLSTYQNNRDHRKILVIDGHTAFTGGVNLADEYINVVPRFGHWKDAAIMIKGNAVKSFTLMFLQLWDIDISYSYNQTIANKYIRKNLEPVQTLPYGGYIIPFSDNPFDREYVCERVYMDILYNAKEYVHIMTPYLILDDEMVTALTYAVKRGVEVVIMMPHIPDKIYAYLLARTYYAPLIEAGVKIYEYTPGFVHAKVFTSDNDKAVVGTINLDFRSLYLHFECAAYIYRNPVVMDIEKDFQQTLEKCHIITLTDCRNYPLIKRLAGRILRLIAPLM